MFAPLITKSKVGTHARYKCLLCDKTKSSGNYWKHLVNDNNTDCQAAWLLKLGRIPKSARDAGNESSLYERIN